jgi:cellulose synthase/poly-beta-1,6-N-acetylglucosamine synthase-like glycosyltransferase
MTNPWTLAQSHPWFGVCYTLGLLYVLIQLIQLIYLATYRASYESEPEEWPFISIWVAARDEAANIGDCLKALVKLDYPVDKLQILVGNDQSTDDTAEIAREWAVRYPCIRVIDIVDNDSGLRAKARVMAQLDVHAQGEYYLITDADVRVKPDWAKYMIRSLGENVGVASGTTMVTSQSSYRGWDRIWSHLQGMDWTYFMGLLNAISYAGVPATAVGNNMIVRKKAYWDTGGYANIKFSITEDYKLYSEICDRGYAWNNVMSPPVLAHSMETKGFNALLHQRKRWLSGGKELPWYWWVLFGVFGLFYVVVPMAIVVLMISNPSVACSLFDDATLGIWDREMREILIWLIRLWGIKWILQGLQIATTHIKVGENITLSFWAWLMLYEVYLTVVTLSTAIFFTLPSKTVWKGRRY